MYTKQIDVVQPIAFADQKLRKIFVMNSDRKGSIGPESLELKDKLGNVVHVPANLNGDMTVLDVKNIKAGGYFLRILGLAEKTIKIILF